MGDRSNRSKPRQPRHRRVFQFCVHPYSTLVTMMYQMSFAQHQLVYNATSFTLASMMASTLFFWIRMWHMKKYQTVMVITGLVTFIAAYHYIRIFNSWVDAYHFPGSSSSSGASASSSSFSKALGGGAADLNPSLTGIPFNDAYRYMDWLLTVPMLLMELVLVLKLSEDEKREKSAILGSAAAIMIMLGYPGELITSGSMTMRWVYWAAAMAPFGYIVYMLVVGLGDAVEKEAELDKSAGPDATAVAPLIRYAQYATVVSWCTYPIVYIFPMIGFTGAGAVVAIQIGYCISDIISKCGVGFLTYTICSAKEEGNRGLGMHD